MTSLIVGLVGASGETGGSILEGLLAHGGFKVVALTRPASVSKPASQGLQARNVEVRELDLDGAHESIVSALKGINILVSAIGATEQLAQIPLATAAAEAGVKRFIPCGFVTVMPVGIHAIRDEKEIVYNHMKRLGLPYTIVDCGWWYQISFPALPSGKIDYAVGIPGQKIPGDGNQESALTDLPDVGKYVARIITDDRVENKMVLVYNEMWSKTAIYDLLEKLSGETIPREYVSRTELGNLIRAAEDKLVRNPHDFALRLQQVSSQYLISWGIRGDNTPEYAKYLGYLTSKELYPDMEYTKYEDYLRKVLDGKAKGVYAERKKQIVEAMGKKNNK